VNLEPLTAKWKAFGWHVQEINGHDFQEIAQAFARAQKEKKQPSIIIAHTTKGKGLSIIEDNNNYHYNTPRDVELQIAKKEGLL